MLTYHDARARPNSYSRTLHWRTLLLLHEITDILVERLVQY
jgi:hypothetical protein